MTHHLLAIRSSRNKIKPHRMLSILSVHKFLRAVGVVTSPGLFPFVGDRIDKIDALAITVGTFPSSLKWHIRH